MPIRIAINGFGRIGRNTLRALYENGYRDRLEVVARTDLGKGEVNTNILRYETENGKFPGSVSQQEGTMYNDGDHMPIPSEKDHATMPCKALH